MPGIPDTISPTRYCGIYLTVIILPLGGVGDRSKRGQVIENGYNTVSRPPLAPIDDEEDLSEFKFIKFATTYFQGKCWGGVTACYSDQLAILNGWLNKSYKKPAGPWVKAFIFIIYNHNLEWRVTIH